MLRLAAAVALSAACAVSACNEEPSAAPVKVPPGDMPPDHARSPDSPGAGSGTGSAIWVVDADGVEVGVLVRRGSDDTIADRAVYDLVNVFHPPSGLFFDVTMSDGVFRYPGKTFFTSYTCDTPVGVSVGGCQDCRSGYGTAFLHDGAWWRVKGGVGYEQMANASTRAGGIAEECVGHSTSNAKAFPVERVEGAAPPTSLTPPLRFDWR